MNYRFIPSRIHGILDYIVAILLVFAPTIFMFNSVKGAAVVIPVTIGAVLFIYSLFTRYEVSALPVIPYPIHLIVDFVAGAFLALSPFLFGFANQTPNAWVPHLIVGILIVLVVLFSRPQPDDPDYRTT